MNSSLSDDAKFDLVTIYWRYLDDIFVNMQEEIDAKKHEHTNAKFACERRGW